MKAIDLIGRRVIAIRQSRVQSMTGVVTQIHSIELEGGHVILFSAFKTEYLPGVEATRYRRTPDGLKRT